MSRLIAAIVALAIALVPLNLIAQETKDSKTEKPAEVKPVFAFVALNKLAEPSVDDVRKNLQEVFGKDHKIEEIEVDKRGVSFTIDGQQAMYGFINKPIPWTDLDDICKTSWIWREATKSLKNHPAHLIVLVLGDEGSHLERNILLTKLLAAASKTFDTAGIYWGHGSVVMSPSQIQKIALSASKDDLPILLWVNFQRQKLPDGTFSLVTEGLEYFDLMEIEVINSKAEPKEILNTVMGVAIITLKGEVIKDGDTIGGEGTEDKIKTHHARSVRDKSKTVLKIDL
jgi:hypothetical protein